MKPLILNLTLSFSALLLSACSSDLKSLSDNSETGSDALLCPPSTETQSESLINITTRQIVTPSDSYLWYDSGRRIQSVYPTSWLGGELTSNVNSPDAAGSEHTATRFRSDGSAQRELTFKLPVVITDTHSLTIDIQLYADISTQEYTPSMNELQLCLQRSDNIGDALCQQQQISANKQWQSLLFDFSELYPDTNVISAGGFEELILQLPVNAQNQLADYYIGAIYGSVVQSPAMPLVGQWGITFPVSSSKLSEWDFRAGAQEVVDELPTVGHVITNFTGFAHGQYFTLRNNPNVDIANEIDPTSVPSEEEEQVIIDVLKILRDGGKKTILYMALDGYRNFNATPEMTAAWESYVDREFSGDEYAAYKNLMMGFVSRFKDMADGYWLDHTTKLPDSEALSSSETLDDFVASIRATHPDAMIAVNDTKFWLKTGPQEWVKVDSDGVDDEDPTDYLIVMHETTNTRSDFTSGHVTPIGQGAPVNSWAYEEFTIPNMVETPWATTDQFTTLKHAWFPVRARWHVPTQELVAEVEQAYRFVRRTIDGGAAITWATTTEYRNWMQPGHIMPDEMAIMKEIDRRLQESPNPDYIPYQRPLGAYLISEDPCQLWPELY